MDSISGLCRVLRAVQYWLLIIGGELSRLRGNISRARDKDQERESCYRAEREDFADWERCFGSSVLAGGFSWYRKIKICTIQHRLIIADICFVDELGIGSPLQILHALGRVVEHATPRRGRKPTSRGCSARPTIHRTPTHLLECFLRASAAHGPSSSFDSPDRTRIHTRWVTFLIFVLWNLEHVNIADVKSRIHCCVHVDGISVPKYIGLNF